MQIDANLEKGQVGMRTILVDDELWSMEQFELEAEGIPGIDVVGKFQNADDALDFAKSNPVDFALLDIEMPGTNGIELGKSLREINPDIVIVYVTSYIDYVQAAYLDVRADYYVLKPYNRKDMEDVLSRARLLSQRQKKRVFFRTFGRFNLFIDGRVVHFSNNKAKELLALCVDHEGGVVTMEEAIDKLWEDRAYDKNVKSLYRKAIIYLHALFADNNAAEVFESVRGACYINKSTVDCDFYDFLDGKDRDAFDGEYMFEYSWAEGTVGRLMSMHL